MRLHNTLSGTVEEFVPREEGRVGMYVCGPTVQGPPHFGHARAVIVPDVLRRYLEWCGYEVFHVRNVTDIDDKIIDRAREEDRHPAEVAEHYTRVWDEQIGALRALAPHVVPRATGHIPEILALIEQLLARGHAYEAGGDVFFSVSSDPDYGKLSGRKPEELRAGARIDPGEAKHDPVDFALWKAAKAGEPSWPSPWGHGRPGWHIECSAMAAKYLGDGFDIHAGGVDLAFPHHENEIAQHESGTGTPFARYWLHNGLLTLDEGKMSKSVGNIIGLAEGIRRYGADTLRMFYLRADYRSPVEFSEERLQEAAAGLERLEAYLRMAGELTAEPAEGEARDDVDAFRRAMDNDLATPQALAVLFDLVTRGHRHLEQGKDAEAASVRDTVAELAGVLGFDPEAPDDDVSPLVEPLVEELLALREDARGRKDFATADRIRDRLTEAGIVVEDTPAGARWHVARVR